MHAIPQVLKAPGEPIDGARPPPLAKIVSPEFAIRFLAGKQMKNTDHDRMRYSDDRSLLPTTCGKALIERGEIRVLGPHGSMRELGQDRSEGAMAPAGFARALLAHTFVVAWGHTGPPRAARSQTVPYPSRSPPRSLPLRVDRSPEAFPRVRQHGERGAEARLLVAWCRALPSGASARRRAVHRYGGSSETPQ
jgi:hypothetical protein